MAAVARRPSTNRRHTTRPKSSGENEKSIWSSLLESVATGKRLPEKTLLILGGTVETQKSFLEALSHDPSQRRRPTERQGTRKPPIANRFALGYTYQDVLDADQDDILARLSEYLLISPHPSFTTLLPSLFTVKSVPDLAITILLDWGEPWNWLRQLRDWIYAIRTALENVDDDVKDALEENMKDWKQRRKGPKHETSTSHDYSAELAISLGPGEWDEPLGVPLCVVCQNAEKIEILEHEHGWKEHDFDTVLIFLRTVLLKHGGSLIYTASAAPGSLQPLTRSMLDIHSILQRNLLKHNVNDRDKVLVPPNWDSWGKIRPLREGFDFEAVSNGWSVDIQAPPQQTRSSASSQPNGDRDISTEATQGSAISSYEAQIRNPTPRTSSPSPSANHSSDIPTPCPSNQEFFARQVDVLAAFKAEDEAAAAHARETRKGASSSSSATTPLLPGTRADGVAEPGRVAEHIGPVQFNMGGIQVDADQMLARLREREAGRARSSASATPEPERAVSPAAFVASPGVGVGDGKAENESLRSFFASLASKGGASGTNSPRGEGK